MQHDLPDFETLNAYVDGELDVAQSAAVARAIAADRELARQASNLSKLRSSIVECMEIPEIAMPKSGKARKRSSGSRLAVMVAAGLAFLILASGSLIKYQMERSMQAQWFSPAWNIHTAWVLPVAGFDVETLSPKLERAAGVLSHAYIPDLSSAKLYLAYTSDQYAIGGQAALLVGYAGTRGCKVSLLMVPTSVSLSEELTYFERSAKTAYGWQAGELDYILMAEGMDTKRFKTVAEAIYKASFERLPVDNKTRMALVESRNTSLPCNA